MPVRGASLIISGIRLKRKKTMLITEGIVIRERAYGESDKFADVLTKEDRVIEMSVKRARKINGNSGSSTQLFAYSKFCCTEKGSSYIFNSAEPIHIFYGLRKDYEALALACYFADVIRSCITPAKCRPDIMRLLLNCLSFLEEDKRPKAMLKSIFEMRLMSDIGFMPDIVGCSCCGSYEPEEAYFDMNGGRFVCGDCLAGEPDRDTIKISKYVLEAVRHIVLTDFNRLFNFRVSDKTQDVLSVLTEKYLLIHLDREFHTLNYYRSLTNIK